MIASTLCVSPRLPARQCSLPARIGRASKRAVQLWCQGASVSTCWRVPIALLPDCRDSYEPSRSGRIFASGSLPDRASSWEPLRSGTKRLARLARLAVFISAGLESYLSAWSDGAADDFPYIFGRTTPGISHICQAGRPDVVDDYWRFLPDREVPGVNYFGHDVKTYFVTDFHSTPGDSYSWRCAQRVSAMDRGCYWCPRQPVQITTSIYLSFPSPAQPTATP